MVMLQAIMYKKFQQHWMLGGTLKFDRKFSHRNPDKKAN